jgi:hypothetical protein
MSYALGSYMLDHVESELEEPAEQSQAEDLTKLSWIKASPGASNSILIILLNFVYLLMNLDCALSVGIEVMPLLY